MKVLLVNPARLAPTDQKYVTFPNGLLYIAAVLEKNGHEVKIFDGNVDSRQPADFVEFAPSLIGFSVASGPKITDGIALSQEFKQVLPNSKIIWGGTHPSALPEETLNELYIDYIAVGAGEYTVLELANCLEGRGCRIDEIKGLVYKQNGRLRRNESRPFIANLDELPDPAWHLVDVNKYWAFALNTSRGCPFKCTYCYNTNFHHGYRADLSVPKIVAQIEHLQKEYGAKSIRFFEDNFTFNRKRLQEFCSEIISRGIKFEWDCEARADLSEEEIAMMAKAGCISVGLGVETGSPRMLKFLKKGMNLPQMEKSFWLFVKYKISPRLYIMHALPTETIEDFAATHEMMARLDFPPYLYMHFVPYPGAPLSNYCFDTGLVTAPTSLAEWGTFITQAGINMNLSRLPNEVLAEVRKNFGSTYTTRRLRFALKHRPDFLVSGITHPGEFFKTLHELFRCSLAFVNADKNKKAMPFDILKSPTIIWFRKYEQAVEEGVAKRTSELTRNVALLKWQVEQNRNYRTEGISGIGEEMINEILPVPV